MNDILSPDSLVCSPCTGEDTYLITHIESTGTEAACAICGMATRTIPISSIAAMVHTVFEKFGKYVDDGDHFITGTRGRTPNEIISEELLECDNEALVGAIVSYLRVEHSRDVQQGATDWYDPTSSTYDILAPHLSTYDDAWQRFVEGVKHGGRFYLDDEQVYLDQIFRPLLGGELHNGTAPIITLGGNDSAITALYRGRQANTLAQQKRIYENPAKELAPPPPSLRTAGRMNAAGVVAFYGATDVVTCVAELRVPIGGKAVIGKFAFLRPVEVLDLRQLSRSSIKDLSWFDPVVDDKIAYRQFMRRLRNLLREPVLPGAETLEYLPTQMIAEYLAGQSLEGVIFVSSVATEAKEEYEAELYDSAIPVAREDDIALATGINVVLFSSASTVQGAVGERRRHVAQLDEPLYDRQTVYVSDHISREREPLADSSFDHSAPPTLRLLEDELTLAVPRAIEYHVNEFSVNFTSRAEERSEF